MDKKRMEALAKKLAATETELRAKDDLRCINECPNRQRPICTVANQGNVIALAAVPVKKSQRRA